MLGPKLKGDSSAISSVSGDASNDVWFAGSDNYNALLMRRNGNRWTIWKVHHGDSCTLNGVKAISPTEVVAVGELDPNTVPQEPAIFLYDGASLTLQSIPSTPSEAALLGVGGGTRSVFAVGYDAWDNDNVKSHTLVMHSGS